MAGKGARSRFEIRIFNITQYYDAIQQDMNLKRCVCNIGTKLTHLEEKQNQQNAMIWSILRHLFGLRGLIETIVTLNKLMIFKLVQPNQILNRKHYRSRGTSIIISSGSSNKLHIRLTRNINNSLNLFLRIGQMSLNFFNLFTQ